MVLTLSSPNDYVDRFAIAQSFANEGNKLLDYIMSYESKYVTKLMGYSMFLDFFENMLLEQKYTVLMNNIIFEYQGKTYYSEGLITMCKYFVYSHYQNDERGFSTSLGKVGMNPEAGSKMSIHENNILAYYNKGVEEYQKLFLYLKSKPDVYPLFKGEDLNLNFFL